MAPVTTGSAPLPVASTGVPGAAVQQPVAGQPGTVPVTPASQQRPTSFSPVPAQATTATGVPAPAMSTGAPATATGGGLAQDVGNSFSRIASFAQQGMDNVKAQIGAIFNSEGGQVDAAKLSVLNQQMSTYQLMMEQAAKLQQKQEDAARAWIR